MSLAIQVHEVSKQRTVLHVVGEIDIFSVNSLIEAIDHCQSEQVCLNLGELLFIDSTGIGVLLRKFLEFVENSRRLVLEEIPESIYEVFDEVGFFQIIQEVNEE